MIPRRQRHHIWLGLMGVFSVIGVLNCSTGQNVILPPPALVKASFDYEGNLEYMPRTIEKASDASSTIVARYRYEVEQGREDGGDFFVPILNQTVIGRSGRWVIAVGRLDLLKDGKEVVRFEAVRDIGSSGLSGKSLSALRRGALLSVREEIERQMLEAARAGRFELDQLK